MASHNGWTNYETFVVKLGIDSGELSQRYWSLRAADMWAETDDREPNQFMSHSDNARAALAERLKSEHDSESEHPVFAASDGSVYADLLNAALSEVNWYEIADSLLSDIPGYEAIKGRRVE